MTIKTFGGWYFLNSDLTMNGNVITCLFSHPLGLKIVIVGKLGQLHGFDPGSRIWLKSTCCIAPLSLPRRLLSFDTLEAQNTNFYICFRCRKRLPYDRIHDSVSSPTNIKTIENWALCLTDPYDAIIVASNFTSTCLSVLEAYSNG